MMEEKALIEYRGTIKIYYGSMTGTSKIISEEFQSLLEAEHFNAPISNIGDFSEQQFVSYEGTVVFFLSTYGVGGPTEDGEIFYQWISSLKEKNLLSKMNFMIFALGNSSFKYFCGHGVKIREFLINLGAKQLMDIEKSDSKDHSSGPKPQFQEWSPKAIKILTQMYKVILVPKGQIQKSFKVTLTKQPCLNWSQESKKNPNLGAQFLNFLKADKAQVIKIVELRKGQTQGRSTLWIRIKKPKQFQLVPGCNISIYPMNILSEQEQKDDRTIEIEPLKKGIKIPFPKMKLKEFKQIINVSQSLSSNIIKNAVFISMQKEEVLQKYRNILAKKQEGKIVAKVLIEDLKLDEQFMAKLGVNNPRPYTLASWNQQQIELIVSLVKDGVTSQYLKSKPKHIYLKSLSGTTQFYIPDNNRPIMMIANGSGMAPFRSIAQFVSNLPSQKRNPLIFFYGCQNIQTDFYFSQQWEQLETKGIVTMKIAESRKNPNQKVYVQHLIAKDLQLLKQHLFTNKGVIFLCGGNGLAAQVNLLIFQAIKLHEKVPYKAYKLHNQLKNKKNIVQEVFH